MKKKLGIIITLLLVTACTSGSKSKLQQYSKSTITAGFDTTITLIGFTKNQKEFDDLFEDAKEMFWKYHTLFDIYNNYEGINNTKTINDMAGIEPVEVDPIIIEMLEIAKHYSEISDYFDVTYGAVYRIWHDFREEGLELNTQGLPGKVPELEVLQEAKLLTGWDKVMIDKEKNTVFLTEMGVRLDVGAIAKGYATEKVALYLEDQGLTHGILSGGGNIRTINNKPDGPWKIGIQEPSRAKDAPSIDILSIDKSYSVVTSGDYQRAYFGPNEVMYSHLINPNTLFPQSEFRSVTIVMESSTLADIFSTSLFMMDYEEGSKFIEQYNKDYPEDKLSVFWVVDDNPEWYQGENFAYMMTDDLIPLSKNLSE